MTLNIKDKESQLYLDEKALYFGLKKFLVSSLADFGICLTDLLSDPRPFRVKAALPPVYAGGLKARS